VILPHISTAKLIQRYGVILLDAYGVLVDGKGALPGAAAFVEELRASGKPFYVVTNDASKLPETAARDYRAMGLSIDAEQLVTAGSLVIPWIRRLAIDGCRCLVLGTADSRAYVEAAGASVVPIDANAEPHVIMVGDEEGYPFLEGVDAAITVALRAIEADRSIHLVCPNPDRLHPKGDGVLGVSSSAVAGLIEDALALRFPNRALPGFERLGKPRPLLYEEALARAGRRDAVMVGDQLDTDIRGADALGLDTVLIGTGVSRPESVEPGLVPTWYLPSLLATEPAQ